MPTDSTMQASQPTWANLREAARVVLHPPFLRRTIPAALAVGTVLFFINHIDEVLTGKAGAVTWIKGIATCLIPFAVSNWGILAATRRVKISAPRE